MEKLSTSHESIEAVQAALVLIEALGIKLRWTKKSSMPFAGYRQDTETIYLNVSMFKKGDALNEKHMQQFAHCLFHELAHAIWSHWGRVHLSNTVDYFEEIWCDNFATDLCKRFSLFWVSDQPSPYMVEFIEKIESIA